jgi:hypothetical protein
MTNLYIGTTWNHIYFGNKKDFDSEDRKLDNFCIEMVSDEMFNALLALWGMDEHKQSIWQLLFTVLENKWPTLN